jgi:Glyoxalase-like domain
VSALPRLRQAVLAARDLDAVTGELQRRLGLEEPYADPGVEYFGLRNAVFALGDTFLEVVSPLRPGTAAGRLIERRGGDTGYMLMFQVEDLAAARERIRRERVREVFEITGLDDMAEVHLHPADMRAAIVSLSQPRPPESWRWGGPDWSARSAPLRLRGARISVADPAAVAARWRTILGAEPAELALGIETDAQERGLTEVILASPYPADPIVIGGVRFVFQQDEDGAATPEFQQREDGPVMPVSQQGEDGPVMPVSQQDEDGPVMPLSQQDEDGPATPVSQQDEDGPVMPVSQQDYEGPVGPGD